MKIQRWFSEQSKQSKTLFKIALGSHLLWGIVQTIDNLEEGFPRLLGYLTSAFGLPLVAAIIPSLLLGLILCRIFKHSSRKTVFDYFSVIFISLSLIMIFGLFRGTCSQEKLLRGTEYEVFTPKHFYCW